MPVMRAVLEFDTKDGSAKIKEVAGGFENVGNKAKTAGDAIKNGFLERIGKSAFDGLVSALKSIPAAFSSSMQAVIDYGGKLVDMKARTGIAIEAQQQLAHAGKLVGVSFEQDLVPAIGKMQQALVDAPEKFMRLGLSVTDLRKMKPEEQFLAIADRIGKIADPAQRAAAAIEIFGKSGVTLLPLLTSNVREAMEEAQRLGLVMSSDVAGAADDLGDSIDTLTAIWDGLIRNFVSAVVTSEPLHRLIKGLTEIIGQFSKELSSNRSTIRDWIDVGIVAGAHAFVEFINVIEAGMATLKAMADLWTTIAFTAEVASKGIHADFDRYNKDMAANQKALDDAVGGTSKAKAAFEQLEKTVAAGVGTTHKATEEETKHTRALADKGKTAEQVARELKAFTKGVADEFNRLLEAEGIPRSIAESMKMEAEQTKLAAERTKDLADYWEDLDAAVAKVVVEDVEAGTKKTERLIDGVRDLADAFDAVGGAAGNFVADGLRAFANLKDVGLQTASVWTKVAVAIEGAAAAYGAGKAAGSPGKGALAGAGKGAAAGAAFGPYGMVIGAVAGAAIGFFGGKSAQKKELKELTAEFDDLMAQASKAGISITKAFDTKSAKGLKQAIIDLNKTLDTTAEAQQKLQDAVERYGFTIEELGPAMARQRLDEQMAQIYQDWELLKAAGVDHQAMLERIGPSVGTLVDQYKTAGVEIPSAMKPIIDDLYQHGKLLHENGEAYTEAEYNGLTYAQTMSQMFADLIKHVEELVAAIRGIPDHTSTITVRTVHTGGGGGEGEGGGGGEEGQERNGGTNRALGLNRWVLPGEPAMQFAEAGRPEYVYASSNGPPQGTPGGGGASGPQTLVIPVSIGGQKLDEIIMRRMNGGYIKVPA